MNEYFVGQKLWIFKDIKNSNTISTRTIVEVLHDVVYKIDEDNDDYNLDHFKLMIISFGDPVYE